MTDEIKYTPGTNSILIITNHKVGDKVYVVTGSNEILRGSIIDIRIEIVSSLATYPPYSFEKNEYYIDLDKHELILSRPEDIFQNRKSKVHRGNCTSRSAERHAHEGHA